MTLIPIFFPSFYSQIPRYIITLHELLAHTPPDHVEKKSLEHARIQLEDLSRQMHDEVSSFHFSFLTYFKISLCLNFQKFREIEWI